MFKGILKSRFSLSVLKFFFSLFVCLPEITHLAEILKYDPKNKWLITLSQLPLAFSTYGVKNPKALEGCPRSEKG
jgi:hypothetical protein